jgi:uncharacterized membrane protein YuzA (DUF378 family)
VNLSKLAWWLLIIGGLNWLIVGLFDKGDIFSMIGLTGWVARVVYILVGLSAVYLLFGGKKSAA